MYVKITKLSRGDFWTNLWWMVSHITGLIADVAIRKHQQQLNEILIFFTSTILEISKIVLWSVMHTFVTSILCETCA